MSWMPSGSGSLIRFVGTRRAGFLVWGLMKVLVMPLAVGGGADGWCADRSEVSATAGRPLPSVPVVVIPVALVPRGGLDQDAVPVLAQHLVAAGAHLLRGGVRGDRHDILGRDRDQEENSVVPAQVVSVAEGAHVQAHGAGDGTVVGDQLAGHGDHRADRVRDAATEDAPVDRHVLAARVERVEVGGHGLVAEDVARGGDREVTRALQPRVEVDARELRGVLRELLHEADPGERTVRAALAQEPEDVARERVVHLLAVEEQLGAVLGDRDAIRDACDGLLDRAPDGGDHRRHPALRQRAVLEPLDDVVEQQVGAPVGDDELALHEDGEGAVAIDVDEAVLDGHLVPFAGVLLPLLSGRRTLAAVRRPGAQAAAARAPSESPESLRSAISRRELSTAITSSISPSETCFSPRWSAPLTISEPSVRSKNVTLVFPSPPSRTSSSRQLLTRVLTGFGSRR